MKLEQLLLAAGLAFLGYASPVAGQKKDDGRHGKYSTPEEKEFHHILHITSQKHTPRSVGNWKLVKEAWDPSVDLITLGHPVNSGIYSTGYWITLQDITPATINKAVDSIRQAMKAMDFRITGDSVSAYLARHTCTIRIEYNTSQLPFHFHGNSIEKLVAKEPIVYKMRSNNADNPDHRAINMQATILGMGPHKQPAIYYYDPESSSKSGYAIAETIRSSQKHPFSIQTIDILIVAPHQVAEMFMKEMDLPGLNALIGKPLL